MKRLIQLPHGIVLVTGPTGSGKTTTLYSCLNSANDVGVKIITTEDPVEYELEGVIQIQVNEEIGVTYTWVRLPDNDRLVIPNERLVSETLRNSTIRSANRLAEVTVHVPLSADLRGLVEVLASEANEAYVADLGTDATIVLRRWVELGHSIEDAESELRLMVHDRLRELGIVQT
jgi:small-conductance mechanosensitive channel